MKYGWEYLKQVFWAAVEGWEIVEALLAFLLLIWSWWAWYSASEEKSHEFPWWVPFSSFCALLIVLWIRGSFQIYRVQSCAIEQLERRLIPQLNPVEVHVAPTHANTETGTVRARYVRVIIRNSGEAKATKCSATLARVEHRRDDVSEFEATDYRDALDMAWSNKRAPRDFELDLNPGAEAPLDIAYSLDRVPARLFLAGIIQPNAYMELMTDPGQYRLLVQITSEGRGVRAFGLLISWNGTFLGLQDGAARLE